MILGSKERFKIGSVIRFVRVIRLSLISKAWYVQLATTMVSLKDYKAGV